MDPPLTSDGKPYGPVRFRQIVEECYQISKRLNTSYNELMKISPTERSYLLQFLERDIRQENEMWEKLREKAAR